MIKTVENTVKCAWSVAFFRFRPQSNLNEVRALLSRLEKEALKAAGDLKVVPRAEAQATLLEGGRMELGVTLEVAVVDHDLRAHKRQVFLI